LPATMAKLPLYLTYGNEDMGPAALANAFAEAWQKAGMPVQLYSFKGGHDYPPDWASRIPDAVRWLAAHQ